MTEDSKSTRKRKMERLASGEVEKEVLERRRGSVL
jgi:hypothetical protein